MLYCFLAKVYNITIQSDFLTGSIDNDFTTGTITYSPGETKSDYQKEDIFTLLKSLSH